MPFSLTSVKTKGSVHVNGGKANSAQTVKEKCGRFGSFLYPIPSVSNGGFASHVVGAFRGVALMGGGLAVDGSEGGAEGG